MNGEYYESLDNLSKAMIYNATWNLGGYDTTSVYTADMYNYEITKTYGSNPLTTTAKIGLMSASDLGYSTTCYVYSTLSKYNFDECIYSDWIINMNKGISEWTITQNNTYIYRKDNSINLTSAPPSSSYQFSPVLYLKDDVLVSSGDGTKDKPYVLYQDTVLFFENTKGKVGLGESKTVPFMSNNYNNIECISNDNSIATCSVSGSSVIINGIKEGTASITLKKGSYISNSYTATVADLSILSTRVEAIDDGTTIDENGVRYSGKDVKNYVKFNDELWQMVGSFDHRVKIMRVVPFTETKYHADTANAKPWLESDLYTYLNGDYYNSINSVSKAMIYNATWRLDGFYADYVTSSEIYNYEGSVTYGTYPLTGVAKVGIINSSDYGYASKDCYASERLTSYSLAICKNSNWMYANADEWTLTQFTNSNQPNKMINASGIQGTYSKFAPLNVRPTVYLNENVKSTSGDGSHDNPYILIYDGQVQSVSYDATFSRYECSTGTLEGDKCILSAPTSLDATIGGVCVDEGYDTKPTNTICWKWYGDPICDAGDTLFNDKEDCRSSVDPNVTYKSTCPTDYPHKDKSHEQAHGYEYGCYKYGEKNMSYTCPTGYTAVGTGADTKCYKCETGTYTNGQCVVNATPGYSCNGTDRLEGTTCYTSN